MPLAGSLGDLPLDDLLVGLGVDFREAEGREALLRGLLSGRGSLRVSQRAPKLAKRRGSFVVREAQYDSQVNGLSK